MRRLKRVQAEYETLNASFRRLLAETWLEQPQ